jgi:hypothetical protein
MTTDLRPVQGRHRAAGTARTSFTSATLPMLFGGVTVVLALVVWQVA